MVPMELPIAPFDVFSMTKPGIHEIHKSALCLEQGQSVVRIKLNLNRSVVGPQVGVDK